MHQSTNDDENSWRRLDWNDVRIFLAVADAGSLNAAARQLGMTQPTISRRMEDLEIRLGARLFARSTKGITLTQSGETMRELAAGMAKLGGSIVRDVAGRDRHDAGRVRVASPDGMASFFLAPYLPEFQRANPEIELSLDCGLWPDAPLSGEIDLSIDFSETSSQDVVSTPIAKLHYCLYASRDYLNTYGAPKSLAELAQHRTVRHSAYREQRGSWHPKAEAAGQLAGTHVITNSSAALVLAIQHGGGIGSLPTAMELHDLNLVMLEDIEPLAHPVLWLRHHPAATRQGRVQRVKEWIQRTFDGADKPWFREDFIHPRDFDKVLGRVHADPLHVRRA